MRLIFSLLAISSLAVFAACQTSANSSAITPNGDQLNAAPNTDGNDLHDHSGKAPRISLADAKKEFDAGAALFIDTRSAAQFQAEHIEGAINIPSGEFDTRFSEVPKGKKIIAYCS